MSDQHDLESLLKKDSETYGKKEPKEHILDLPDTYIGSIEPSLLEGAWIAHKEGDNLCFVQKDIMITMGLYKIFDEVLVNAADNITRTREAKKKDDTVKITKTLKVNIDHDGSISVYNDGDGIPVVQHMEHKVLIPDMIFGQLLTSSNYDKEEKKLVGGKNGFGAKLTNLFSKKFVVETVDHRRKKKYEQTWVNNMTEPEQPGKVTSYRSAPYTKVTFHPDFERFGVDGFSPDMVAFLQRRVYDIAGCSTKDVTVYFNDEKLSLKSFESYVDLYIGPKSEAKRVYESPNDRWEVIACDSPDGNFRQVSFVNYICTIDGGKHTEYISNQIARNLAKQVNDKGKSKTKGKKSDKDIQSKHVKSNLWIFVNAKIENPGFTSQTKGVLATPVSKFGSKCELSDDFLKKMEKLAIVERAKLLKGFHDKAGMSKTDGKKTKTLRGIAKLDDANWAGTTKSDQCILILTEGDSAKNFAVAGLSVLGRDRYGVFPLKGKPLNVRDATSKQLLTNAEFENLKKIVGLQQGKKYSSINELRYGKIMVLTDQDPDGSHIKGLMMNMIDHFWPELQDIGFVISMHTPIVKVFKGSGKKRKAVKTFFTLQEYRAWKERNPWVTDKNITYYKGLGTSNKKEVVEYFKTLSTYAFIATEASRERLDLAFNKKRADGRKAWLRNYVEHNILDVTAREVKIEDFIDQDLIHFSNYDNIRSLPSMCDGQKISQRKALFGMRKMKVKDDRKVSDIYGTIMSETRYHHGEASMIGTITGMADDYVGSNNINLFVPAGMFGTRNRGGKDCASARYVSTCLSTLTGLVFKEEDEKLLEYVNDDGKLVEPKWFMPVIPMILVNGAHGIGTGFSTHVPCFNPNDLIAGIMMMMEGKKALKLKPWYRGFKGQVVTKGGKWFTEGIMTFKSGNVVEISELPIGIWVEDYHAHLENLLYDAKETDPKKKANQCIVSYRKEKGHGHDNMIKLTLTFKPKIMAKMKNDTAYLKKMKKLLKLEESKSCSVTNLHMFDPFGRIVKFKTVDGILRSFYKIRLIYYTKRRDYWIKAYEREVIQISEKVRFIEGMIAEIVQITKKDDPDILVELRDKHKFIPDPMKIKIPVLPISRTAVDKALEGEIFTQDEDTDISSAHSDAETDASDADDDDDDSSDSSDSSESDENDDDDDDNKELVVEEKDERDPSQILRDDYGYLISMQIRTLTQKKADELRAEKAKKEAELERLRSLTPKDIWRNDLLKLTEELDEFMNVA